MYTYTHNIKVFYFVRVSFEYFLRRESLQVWYLHSSCPQMSLIELFHSHRHTQTHTDKHRHTHTNASTVKRLWFVIRRIIFRPDYNRNGWLSVNTNKHYIYIYIRTLIGAVYHGRHGSKRRKLAQHAHSRGSHAFTHTITTTLYEAPAQLLHNSESNLANRSTRSVASWVRH